MGCQEQKRHLLPACGREAMGEISHMEPSKTCQQTCQQFQAPIQAENIALGAKAGLIQSVSQALWPERSAFGSLSGLAPALCPKPALLQPISI